MSSDSRLGNITQIQRSGGARFNRTTRNAQARNIIAGRTGRGTGGTATRTQLREALANQGSRRGRRFRTL